MAQLHPKAVWLFWWRYFWISLILSFVLIVVSMFIFAVAGNASFLIENIFSLLLGSLILWIVLALGISYVWARLAYNNYSFEITQNTIKINRGVIIKHSSLIPYERIQNVDIIRGIIARLLNLSEIFIQTAGSSTPFTEEGKIPGLDQETAEKIKSMLIRNVRGAR